MKKLFLYLLKKYSRTEKQRLEIYEALNEQVCNDYHEQTGFGNIYNAHIEFILANNLIRGLVEDKQTNDLNMVSNGLIAAYKESLKYIESEKRKKKLKRILK